MKHECNLIDSPYFPKWPQNIIYNLFLIWEPVKDHTLHLVVISPLIENKFSFFFFFPLSSTFLKSLGPLPCRMSHTQLVFDCVLMITFRVNIFGKNIALVICISSFVISVDISFSGYLVTGSAYLICWLRWWLPDLSY